MFADLKHQGYEEVFLVGPGTHLDICALDAVLQDLDADARVIIHIDAAASEAIDTYSSSGVLCAAVNRGAHVAFVGDSPEAATVIEAILAGARSTCSQALVTTNLAQAHRWFERAGSR